MLIKWKSILLNSNEKLYLHLDMYQCDYLFCSGIESIFNQIDKYFMSAFSMRAERPSFSGTIFLAVIHGVSVSYIARRPDELSVTGPNFFLVDS